MILVIDNYDSFTFNLVQYIGLAGNEIKVVRNDKISIDEINELQPKKIVISPGPGYPDQAGISMDVISHFASICPILGVCLGHQSIGQIMGGTVIQADEIYHGKSTEIFHDEKTIYQDIKNPFMGGRYHSLIVARETIPDCLEISAETKNGIVMGLRHKEYPLEGVQFHPESILTEDGKKIVSNFLNLSNQEEL